VIRKWWGKLKSLFKRKEAQQQPDYYYPTDRHIFSYFNGEKEVKVDPIVLYRKMIPHKKVIFAENPSPFDSLLSDDPKGYIDAISKIREVFDLKSFEEGGVTEVKCFEVLNSFIDYCHNVQGLPVGPYTPPKPTQETAKTEEKVNDTANQTPSPSPA
jgi:hypothetical protein